jgi:hypothetical protein
VLATDEPTHDEGERGPEREGRGRCESRLDRARDEGLREAELVAQVGAECIARHQLAGDLVRERRRRWRSANSA